MAYEPDDDLSDSAKALWRKTYKKFLSVHSGDHDKAKKFADRAVSQAIKRWALPFVISKVDVEQRVVTGWAAIVEEDGEPVVDRQGDIIPPQELEKSAFEYVEKSRVGGVMHQAKGVATLIGSLVTTRDVVKALFPLADLDMIPVGWAVQYRVHDDTVWKGVRDGTYTGFSIHGRGTREEVAA